MASPDTIILLIIAEYHAAIRGETPVPPPLAYTLVGKVINI